MSGGLTITGAAENRDAWTEIAERHPEATLFHTPDWEAVVARRFRYRFHSRIAFRGGRAVGLLPLAEVPTLPSGRALVSTPLGVYGGPLADDDAVRDALLADARAIAVRRGARYVEYRNRTAAPGLPAKDLYVTFRKGILPDPDQNLAAIPRNQRRSIRVAMRHGLEPSVGGAELLDPFFHVFSQSVRNLGSPVFPKALFADFLATMGPACRILVVRHQGAVVAGVLTFYHRDTVLPYYGGALKEAFPLSASDFMYWSLLCDAAARGLAVFDFGRSKRGSGSFDFKRHWGFEPTPLAYQYDLVRQRSLPDLSPKNPKFAPAIGLWRRLPLPVTQWLGPRLVRYFP